MKDRMKPSICGIGFLGYGEHKASVDCNATKVYIAWKGMLKRCYCQKSLEKQPTYKGCTVHLDWHNFQNFAKWYYDHHPTDGETYRLDKDYLVKGNKVYSPNTCCFLTTGANSVLGSQKLWKVKSLNALNYYQFMNVSW